MRTRTRVRQMADQGAWGFQEKTGVIFSRESVVNTGQVGGQEMTTLSVLRGMQYLTSWRLCGG
jgi:hypothetical protein